MVARGRPDAGINLVFGKGSLFHYMPICLPLSLDLIITNALSVKWNSCMHLCACAWIYRSARHLVRGHHKNLCESWCILLYRVHMWGKGERKSEVQYSWNKVVIMLVPNGIKMSKRVIKRVNLVVLEFFFHPILQKKKENLLEKTYNCIKC